MTPSQASTGKAQFKKRLTQARVGDPQAQYEVGIMCANGVGTRRSPEEALVWFKSAAAKGHATAQYLVAIAYANGVGCEKDEYLAVQGFFKAADQGSDKALLKLARRVADHHGEFKFHCCLKAAAMGLADAQYEIAEHFARGVGVPRNEATARVWYERAAKQGVARAQYVLADLLAQDAGSGPLDEEALRWYRAAAAQGHTGAQLVLARRDGNGEGRTADGKRRGRKGGGEDRRKADNRWARFAERGEAEDRYHLGCMHEAGIEVEQDDEQARRWYLMAAEDQHRDAQVALARLCEGGDSAEDQALAWSWWEQAAQLGSAEAQYRLGQHLAADLATPADRFKSLSWTMRAAEQGHAEALMALHALLTSGTGPVAEACLQAAAEQGHPQAQFEMGRRFAAGAQVDPSPEQAHDWLERAAQQGHADAQCALGDWYAAGHGRAPDFVATSDVGHWHAAGHGSAPDFVLARAWYDKAAQQGHVKAQWLLGGLYATGAEGVPRDGKLAALWCKKAASAGFAPAQATLGTLFAQAKKMDRAVPWWSKAAVQGDPEAQFNLANAYRAGAGVKTDYRTAFLLWTNAAAAGVPAAQTRLGLAYAKGEGAAADPIEATKWFMVAQRAGDAAAAANCQHAQSLLSPVQLAEAEWRADEWTRTAQQLRRHGAARLAEPASTLQH